MLHGFSRVRSGATGVAPSLPECGRLFSRLILPLGAALVLVALAGESAIIAQARPPAPARPQGKAQPRQGSNWRYQLTAVETTGLKRFTQAHVLAMTGLIVGRDVGPNELEAARQRLLQSGLFVSVGYRLRNPSYRLTVTFTVEEAAWPTPIVFDNFVDHTDAQLIQDVARDLPTFDGVTPDHPIVLARIVAALERIARESKDPGAVSYLLIDDAARHIRHYRFHLDRQSGVLPICTVDVSGATTALEATVKDRLLSLMNTDYSRDFTVRFAQENLIPIFGVRGFVRASVARVGGQREPPRAGCDRGVAVSVTLDPGIVHSWKGVEWMGNRALASADLERLIPLAIGDIADTSKIERGLAAVEDTYRRNGYFTVHLLSDAVFDDAASLRYRIRVAEGQQYRMGSIQIVGLPEDVASRVRNAWQLTEGAVFDATYPARFARDIRQSERAALAGISEIKTWMGQAPGKTVINVTLTFVGRQGAEPSRPALVWPPGSGTCRIATGDDRDAPLVGVELVHIPNVAEGPPHLLHDPHAVERRV